MKKLLVTAIALFAVLTTNVGQSFAACGCGCAVQPACPICQPACPVCQPACPVCPQKCCDPCATGFACPCQPSCNSCCNKCDCGYNCCKRSIWDKLFRRNKCCCGS